MNHINPHESEIICNILVENNLVYGCAKPFIIMSNDDNHSAEKCDYI